MSSSSSGMRAPCLTELPCCLMTPLMVGKNLKMIRGSKSCQRLFQRGSILLGVHVLEEDIQEDRNARGISPVSLEVSTDGELRHDMDTGVPHPSIPRL